MSSMSRYLEKALLEQVTKKAVAPTISEVYLALCTAVPTSSDTTLAGKEATYTGYARLKLEGAQWKAAVEGAPSKIVNESHIEFAACTAGSSKIVAVALCDNKVKETGHVLVWTAVTEFEVSTSATPVEAAAEAIEFTLS